MPDIQGMQLELISEKMLNQQNLIIERVFKLITGNDPEISQKFLMNKLGCVFPMVISSDFRMGEHRDDDHEEDAPYFSLGLFTFSVRLFKTSEPAQAKTWGGNFQM